MSPRRSGVGPGAYRTAVGIAAAVVVVRAVLLALDGLDRLQDLRLADPFWPALAVLLGLLLVPYVSEVEAGGVRFRRQGAGATAGESADLAAGAPAGASHESAVAAARLLGLQLALAGAGTRFPELAGFRLHLHVPDDTGRLLPVVELDDPDDAWARGWDPGRGVVGRAFQRAQVQAGRGDALREDVRDLPDKPEGAFARLTAVLAVPLLNTAWRPIGVVSAASSDPRADPPSRPRAARSRRSRRPSRDCSSTSSPGTPTRRSPGATVDIPIAE